MATQTITKRRQLKEISISLPVEVSDVDGGGAVQKERTNTLYIGPNRASLRTKRSRPINSDIYLELPLEKRGCLCRVEWISSQRDAEGYFEMDVDIGFVESFWPIQFPKRFPVDSA